jgi:hypothetical protein
MQDDRALQPTPFPTLPHKRGKENTEHAARDGSIFTETALALQHVGLHPSLPASALSSHILMGGIEGEEHVLQGDRRQRETP